MKERRGFVSNSSSSSFVISKYILSQEQIDKIKNYGQVSRELDKQIEERNKNVDEDDLLEDTFNYDSDPCGWVITEKDSIISGETIVDNFCMHKFLEVIGVSREQIKWGN